VVSGTTAMCTCILASGTTETSWEAGLTDFSTFTGTGSVVLGNTPTLANPTINAYTESVLVYGNTSTAVTINIANSTIVTATLTANCTFTMPSNTAGKSFILLLKTGNGGFTSTFTGVKFPANTAPTITTANNSMDILSFIADGANWYGNFAQGYIP
jgi:molybdopterin-binding protein